MAKFNEQEFLKWCRAECKKHNVKFKRGTGKNVNCDGLYVSGYFDGYNTSQPTLSYGSKNKIWFEVLAHEISHMFQWVDNTQKWQNYLKASNTAEWLNGKKLTDKKLVHAIIATIEMERECEVNSLKLLKRFGYEKGEAYIQCANAYTLFYFHMMKTRKWYKRGYAPYDHPEIWKKFPKTFNINIFKTYKKLASLYDKCTA